MSVATALNHSQRSIGGRAFTLEWGVHGAREHVAVVRQDPPRTVAWTIDRDVPAGESPAEPAAGPVDAVLTPLLRLLRPPPAPPPPRAHLVRAEFSELPGVIALVRADGRFEGRFFGACCYPHALEGMPCDPHATLPRPVHGSLVRARVGPTSLDPAPRSAVCIWHGQVQVAVVCDRHLESGRWHRGLRRPAMETFEFIGGYRVAITYRDGSVRVRRYLRDAHVCLAGEPLALAADGRHLVAWTVEAESMDAGWRHVQDGLDLQVMDLARGVTASRAWVPLAPGTGAQECLEDVSVAGAWPRLEARLSLAGGGGRRVPLARPPQPGEDGHTAFFCHEKTVRDRRPGHECVARRLVVHLHRAADMVDLGRHEIALSPAAPPAVAARLLREHGVPWLEIAREGGGRERHRLGGAH